MLYIENPRSCLASSSFYTRANTSLDCCMESIETRGLSRMHRTPPNLVVADRVKQQSSIPKLETLFFGTLWFTVLLRNTAWKTWSDLLSGSRVCRVVFRPMWSCDLLVTHMIILPRLTLDCVPIIWPWSSEAGKSSNKAAHWKWRWRKGANCSSTCSWLCVTT